MSGHTPGPWWAGPQSEISGWVDIRIDGYTRNPVASATPAGPGGPEERRDSETAANARLIAAAPDLLFALETLLSEAENFSVSGVYFNESCFAHEGPALAYAAIAKATGATP